MKQAANTANLLTNFLAFAFAQPKDRRIKHGLWKHCSVGDFNDASGLERKDEAVLRPLILGAPELYSLLNANGRIWNPETGDYGPCLIKNYGELQTYAIKHWPELLEAHNIKVQA